MLQSLKYCLLGSVASLGAPGGLMVARLRQHHVTKVRFDQCVEELRGDRMGFLYVAISTLIVFATYGAALGRQIDRSRAVSDNDPLTELPNIRKFRDRLQLEIERAKRSGECLSLLFIDLDRLKSINDAHGHPAGDSALRHIARCITRSLRASDLGARLGGDEFGVLAPRTTQQEGVALAHRLADLVRNTASRGTMPVTVSIGVATAYPQVSTPTTVELDALFARADAALYTSKRAGRGTVRGESPAHESNSVSTSQRDSGTHS